MLVSRDSDGVLNRTAIPLYYVYGFVAAAVIGLFTITGLAGSYSRMLIKTARFNQLRQDHDSLQKNYAHLEKTAHEREIQAASLGSLATEVSALYGFTANKLALPLSHGKAERATRGAKSAGVASAELAPADSASFSNDSYYKSVDTFYALRNTAMSGQATRFLPGSAPGMMDLGKNLGRTAGLSGLETSFAGPTLWPVMGSISSGFGQREDPVLGSGEGEFHKGIDIAAPQGTPIHATADGTVVSASSIGNGYGREVVIDHGHGLTTIYGHMSAFNVIAGQAIFRGQVIGYVGHSGRSTGNHVHYEVRINDTAVNPHKYLRETLAHLGEMQSTGY